MGAAAGKNLQPKDQGQSVTAAPKKVKEIGVVEMFDNEDDDDAVPINEGSLHSTVSPRATASPNLFHRIHSQSDSPVSRLSANDDNSPTSNRKDFAVYPIDTDKTIPEISYFEESDDRILENLQPVAKYVDENREKNRRRKGPRTKRSPVAGRNRRIAMTDEGIGSEPDEDETTSVLSYDVDDDITLGEEEDKYFPQSFRSARRGKIPSKSNFSPSYNAQMSPTSPHAYGTENSSLFSKSPAPPHIAFPKIKEPSIQSEEKNLSKSPKSSSYQTSGISGIMKGSYDVLANLESIPEALSSNSLANSTNSLHSLDNADFIDKKNSVLLGLHRQKIWSYAHNAQLEREVQELQRQLDNLDTAFSAPVISKPSPERPIAAITSLNRSPRSNRRTIQANAQQPHTYFEESSKSIASDASSLTEIKKNVASIRARVQQTRISRKGSTTSRTNGGMSDEGGDSDTVATHGSSITFGKSTATHSSSRRDTKQPVGDVGVESLADDESGESDLEMSHSSIIDPAPPARVNRKSSSGLNRSVYQPTLPEAKISVRQSSLLGRPVIVPERKSSSHINEHISHTDDQQSASQSSRRIINPVIKASNSKKFQTSLDSSSSDSENGNRNQVNISPDSKPFVRNLGHEVSSNTSISHPRSLRPSEHSSKETSSTSKGHRLSLRVHTNEEHVEPIVTLSQPSSTTSIPNRTNRTIVSKQSRSSSGLSNPPTANHTSTSAQRPHSPDPSGIDTKQAPSPRSINFPSSSSPRARLDQNKDVLRRLNRRQKKSNLDSESDANSASEDESYVSSSSVSAPLIVPDLHSKIQSHSSQPPSLLAISEYAPKPQLRSAHPQAPTQGPTKVRRPRDRPTENSNPRRPQRQISDDIPKSSQSQAVSNPPLWSKELESSWNEVRLLLRRKIDTEADMHFTIAAAEAGLLYSDQLNAVAKSLNVLRGTISRWILPFDNNTRLDGQCSTPMSVLERMPDSLRGKISDRQIHYLVSGANSVRQLVRIKIADDNDLEQARQALQTSTLFFKRLQEESQAANITSFQLLQKLG